MRINTGFEIMEIDEIRQELNDLLENVVDHSGRYSAERPIPSLEISFVLSKINKMQENLIILKYLLEEKEKFSKALKTYKTKHTIEEKNQQEQPKEVAVITEKEEVVVDEPVKLVDEAETENSATEKSETVQKKTATIEKLPIIKITDALTLNDRYLFANELFNKDMSAFNEFIKEIDNASNINVAKEKLFALNLDMDNEYVASFSELIDRRFS